MSEVEYDDVQWYLDRLEGVEGAEGQWQSWCPCHDDVGTEWKGLGITEKGGKILIRCYSCGAQLPQVYEALADTNPDDVGTVSIHITPASKNGNGHEPDTEPEVVSAVGGRGMTWWIGKTGVPEEVWNSIGCFAEEQGVSFTFTDNDARKIRKPPKEIVWVNTSGADAPPLWPMPAGNLPAHISIWEGESDCGTAHAAGLPYAFAVTKGSKGALPAGWAATLKERGVERITVGGDADEGGILMRNRLAREAVAAGLTVEVVRLEDVIDPFSGINDLNGLWKECETIEEFNVLIASATHRVAERLRVFTVDEMEEIAAQEINWLIPDLIAPGDKIILAAPQKSLKSWMTLDLMRAGATGQAFLMRSEWTPTRTFKSLYVQEEGAPTLWARRVHMLRLTGNPHARFAHRTGFRFTDPAYVDELIATCREEEFDLVALDPLQRMIPGIDENSSTETGIVWDEVARIQQALPNMVVMIVHHANRAGALSWTSIRGSSRHGGEVDLGIFIEKHPMEDKTLRMWLDGRDIPETLSAGEVMEVKYEINREERTFKMDGTEITVNITSPGQMIGKANRDKVYGAVMNGKTLRKEIMEDTELGEHTVREHLDKLVEEGVIEEVDNGKGKAKTYVPKTEDK